MKKIKKSQKPKKKHRLRNFFLTFCLFSICTVAVVVLVAALYIRQRLNSLGVIDAQYLQTYETSKILDKNGDVIWEPTDHRVTILEYEEIPKLYLDALIATEDSEYWSSPGISYKGIANMVYTTIRSKFDNTVTARGGSTIEQQLIKNVYYNGGSGYETTTRKIQEIFLALQLDENFTKEEIITYYVNQLEFAEGATGLGQIMKTYFNKKPKDYETRSVENITELAYLAGLSKAPTTYNLYSDPDSARERTNTVLGIMKDSGKITEQEYQEALAYDLTSNLQKRGWEAGLQIKQNRKWKIYTDGVLNELKELGYDINKASIEVKTFLDPKVFNDVTKIARQKKFYLDKKQQAAVAVVDNDGVVVALVGSRTGKDEFNRATSKNRSSGSSMKPFTAYGPLLQFFGNKYNTATKFDTSNYKYPGTNLYMHNYGGGLYGYQTMQKSLRKSYNTPVARICDEILGSNRMKTFLHGLGLDEEDKYSAQDGIGLYISPLQSAAAYNALSNYGTYTKPRFINTITFSDGSKRKVKPRTLQAMNPSVAWVTTQMLRGVITSEGTAAKYGVGKWDGYAAKTGSVKFDDSVNPPNPYGDGGSDMWFCSYTKDGYAVSVWCGYDKPNTSPQIPSSYTGQKDICTAIQKYLNGGKKITNWKMPDGVKQISGSGIQAHYKVTDSMDIGDTDIKWENLDASLLTIKAVKAEHEINDSWADGEDPWWVAWFKENGTRLPDVIDMDTYTHLEEE